MNIPQHAKEKLQRYYQETYIQGLTQHQWRKNLARRLHQLAEKLEPQTKGGGQAQTDWCLISDY